MRIESRLRQLFGNRAVADPQVRDALARELAGSFGSAPARPRSRWRWFALAGLGGAVLAGACVVPTDYEVEVGLRMLVTLVGPEGIIEPAALGRHIEQEFSPHELRVMVSASSLTEADESIPREPPSLEFRIAVDLVGEFDPDEVEAAALTRFPVLRTAQVEIEALDGTVHGTFGGMLSERALGLQLDRESVEETRARILADLAARGLDGNATIEISDEQTPGGHRREVRVRVETETPAGGAAAGPPE